MNGKLNLHGPILVAGFIEDGKITLERPWLLIPAKPEAVQHYKDMKVYDNQRSRNWKARQKTKRSKP